MNVCYQLQIMSNEIYFNVLCYLEATGVCCYTSGEVGAAKTSVALSEWDLRQHGGRQVPPLWTSGSTSSYVRSCCLVGTFPQDKCSGIAIRGRGCRRNGTSAL